MNTTSIPSAASPVALDLRTTVTIGKALGLPLIPIPARAKSPVAAEWRKAFVEDDFDTNGNVGLRLDAVFDGDMGSEYALKLARGRAARNTRAAGVEGRPGRPRSADPRAPKIASAVARGESTRGGTRFRRRAQPGPLPSLGGSRSDPVRESHRDGRPSRTSRRARRVLAPERRRRDEPGSLIEATIEASTQSSMETGCPALSVSNRPHLRRTPDAGYRRAR